MSRSLDGSTQYGISTVDLFSDTADYSIVVWYKPDDATREQFIFGQDRSTSFPRCNGAGYRGDQAGDPSAYFAETGSSIRSDGDTPTLDDWNITVITKESGVAGNIYTNSVTPSVTSFAGAGINDVDSVVVGMFRTSGTTGALFSGLVAHAAIWDKILTAGEIANLITDLDVPNTVAVGNLTEYWAFDESGSTDTGDNATVITWTGSPSQVADDPLASGPTITDINTTNNVFPGQSAVITGTGFEAVQGTGTVVMGGVTQTVTSWADTSITITVVQGNMDYNNDHSLVVTNDSAEASAALTTTLSADSDHNEIDVSMPVSDNTSLFYLASPAVVTGDQLETPKLTDQGKTLTVAADGTFVITAASGLQTFSIRIWDASDETWSASTIATINGVVVSSDMVSPMVSNMVTGMVN